MTSFPSGLLRYAGYWVATEQYSYGMYVVASDNKAYSCGAPTDTGTDPTVQPSVVWFLNPNPGSGSGAPNTWSEYPATQLVRLDQLANLEGDFGTDGQVLSSDGTKVQWVTPSVPALNPVQVIGDSLSAPATVTMVGITVIELTVTPTIQSKAFVTVTMNYEVMAPGTDTLTVTLKNDVGGGDSIVIDDAVLTSIAFGSQQSCALSGTLGPVEADSVVNVRVIAESSGEGAFKINKANLSVIYNIVDS